MIDSFDTAGLGTSSILAGAILAVLWKASGKVYDHQSLIHAVSTIYIMSIIAV